jgi:FkbM family methyltransferase
MEVPDARSFLWQFKEIFADESYRFQADTDAPLIYNCGANVGVDTLYFKRLYPKARIKAFEADPTVADYLRRNVAANRLKDVEVIAEAVWTENTTVSFASEGADGGSVVTGTANTQIPATRLRDRLARETAVDLLKMDIEGAETAVIEDCADVLHRVRHVFIEYHAYLGQPQSLQQVLAILAQNGFRYFLRPEADRRTPFINRTNRQTPQMDLQVNIFAYRSQ